MADFERDLPSLMDLTESAGSLMQPSFHESSTNVSLADSAAATLGSESVPEMSDRGLPSEGCSSSNSDSESDIVESPEEENLKVMGQYQEMDLSTDDDWVEEKGEMDHMQKIKDLFSSEIFPSMHSFLENLRQVHKFDLSALKKRHNMDQYGFIRLVNFVRSCNPTPREVLELDMPIWDQDKFMIPVIEDDPLLMYDFDEDQGQGKTVKPSGTTGIESDVNSLVDEIEDEARKGVTPNFGTFGAVHVANAEGGHVTLTQTHFDDLHTALRRMQLAHDESQAALKQCQKDMNSMRQTMHHMVGEVKGERSALKDKISVSSGDDVEDDEDGYFTGYAHFSIHHDMLADKPRTESYRDAIMRNSRQMAGKVVLDLGCGTGILSMFAVQAGAAKVIGVDQSHIIFNAMAIIRENHMEDKIKLVRGRIEEVTLGEPQVDVLVSEWMGYFLLFEGMLDSVIHARNKYLAPDGLILPNACSIEIMAVGDLERYADMVGFWDSVYGLKMTSMKPEVLREASIEIVPTDKILSPPAVVLSLDLKTCHVQDTEFFTAFKLTISRDDQLTALVGSFDVAFNLEHTATLPTSPYDPPTHWKQTVFYLPQPLAVRSGQVLDCSIQVRRHRKGNRWLEVVFVIDGEKLKYTLS